MQRLTWVWVSLALGLGASGCRTNFGQANHLAQQGRFVEAAELFDRLMQKEPDNPELRALRDRARSRAVEQALSQARQARLSDEGDAAHQAFAAGLALRKRWDVKLNGALEGTVEDEKEYAERRLRQLTGPHLQAGEALTAQGLVGRQALLLSQDELAGLNHELSTAVRQTGQATCARLLPQARATTPYWTEAVARYCEHFQADSPRTWPLPDTLRLTRATAQVEGAGPGAAGLAESVARSRFLESPWAAERAVKEAALSATGSFTLQQEAQPVTLSAEWTERIPYSVEVVKELEESVPVQECEVEETRSSAGERSQRMKQVTRKKTQTREEVVKETRWREVPRVFTYQALRTERTLGFSGRMDLQSEGLNLSTAGWVDRLVQHGHVHDSAFEPAKVRPSRLDFADAGAWLAGRTEALGQRFAQALEDGWRARFCAASAYGLEEAARCARVAKDVPAAALETLQTALGADAQRLPALLGPAGSLPVTSQAR